MCGREMPLVGGKMWRPSQQGWMVIGLMWRWTVVLGMARVLAFGRRLGGGMCPLW